MLYSVFDPNTIVHSIISKNTLKHSKITCSTSLSKLFSSLLSNSKARSEEAVNADTRGGLEWVKEKKVKKKVNYAVFYVETCTQQGKKT